MNSGKSTALMQVAYNYEERGMRVLIMKPSIDTKGGEKLMSRLGVERRVDIAVRPDMDPLALVRADIAKNGTSCLRSDGRKPVFHVMAGRTAFHGDCGAERAGHLLRPAGGFFPAGFSRFHPSAGACPHIEEMKTICQCGRKAMFNGRKVNGKFVFEGAQVAIDMENNVQYESLCPQCYFRERDKFFCRKGGGGGTGTRRRRAVMQHISRVYKS